MKKGNLKEWIRRILLVVCVCVFCYSIYQLLQIYLNYKKIEDQTDSLIEEYVETEDDDPLTRVIDFDTLLERNEDVIGWIYIPDTEVDEPILKGENNDTYLRTSIDHEYLTAGCIFVEETNNGDFSDDNTIIYGHSMNNGSRFYDITKYDDTDYYNEHNTVYIYTLDGNVSIYTIYVSKVIYPDDDMYVTSIDDYESYINAAQSDALNVSDIDTSEKKSLILLSTCNLETNKKRNIVSAYLSEIYER